MCPTCLADIVRWSCIRNSCNAQEIQRTAASNQVSRRTDASDLVHRQNTAFNQVPLRADGTDQVHRQAATSNRVSLLTDAAGQVHRQTQDSNAAQQGGTDQIHGVNGSGYMQQRPSATDNRALPYGHTNVRQRGARFSYDSLSGHELASFSNQMEELRISEDAPRPIPENVMQSMIEDEVLCHFDQINAVR